MKKILLAACVLLAFSIPVSAQARPGQLDKSFGGDGRVITRIGVAPTAARSYLAWAGGGQIVAAFGTHLVEYLSDGRLNKRFGSGGRVKIESVEGSIFAPSGLAIDSQDRILVSGTVSRVEPGESGRLASSAVVVRRILPSGEADKSFGSDGIAWYDFGFPHPTHEGVVEERGPFVGSSGLLVDSADRAVLTGSWLSYNPFPCYYLYCYSTSTPFVARLKEDGSLDGDFGNGGVFVSPVKEGAFAPTPDGEHVLFIAANISCVDRCGGAHPVLGQLDGTGSLDPDFGSSGLTELPFSEYPSVAVDRFARIMLVGANWESSTLSLQRLSPRGVPDKRFGEEGVRGINLPGGAANGPESLAVDQHGRAIFALGARRAGQPWVVLLRRNPRGGSDQGFGRNGQVWTRFPDWTSPTQILLGGNGKIVLGGTEGEHSLALARYYGGS
jgi:uncharacterized delta-60 repeat protein